MAKQSAGILLFRRKGRGLEVLLVHPGGPFFAKKDAGHWTIPKGEYPAEEEPLQAAIREFEEETGYRPQGQFIPLHPIKQKGGKVVLCWAVSGNLDADAITSNTFTIEWPPRSGKQRVFPEIDRAAWYTLAEARQMMNERQTAFLDELAAIQDK
ncbi:NUDIX domain-containing protein [Chitinophaga agrisoli]|uniref:NUDIX domain-containing protein n=1 Tax=Chitinophaga agrisoli TaxID=2607653 RepID=A0A5B2VMP5_9BACT|nr:NUDIX domain-containing protein [Chitinophaga agrisoli]KAA2239930.1 NUDIX domain-containing protein [Chitinophaga agrisoli]